MANALLAPYIMALVDKDIVSEKYAPERDREIPLGGAEALNWVPKEALDLTRSFLDRLFPRIPIHPFMMLLLQLNKVWHKHEAACIKDLRRRHKEAMLRQRHRDPYREVLMENKILHLRKQLDSSRNDKQRLEQYRKATKASKSVRGGSVAGGEHKVLLEWGLATIENLSKQVADTLNENKILKRRLAAGGRPVNSTAGVVGVGNMHVRKGPGYHELDDDFSSGDEEEEGGQNSDYWPTPEEGGENGDDDSKGASFIPPHQDVLTVRDFQDDDLVAEAAAATAQPRSVSVSSDAFAARSLQAGSGRGKKIVVRHSKSPTGAIRARRRTNDGGTTSPASGWVTISHTDPRPLNTRPLN